MLRIGPHSLRPGSGLEASVQALTKSWRQTHNVTQSPTATYGLVIFKDRPDNVEHVLRTHVPQGRPFVRLSSFDCKEAPQMVKDLLVSKWDLEPPRILLGVTGGAGSFELPPKLEEMVKLGLVKAAQSESMWITTGGTNTGVMKYVAEAIAASGAYVPVLGILPWSVVTNKDALETYPDGKPVSGGLVYYGDPDSHTDGWGKGCSLDRNHTHFLIVDDGTVGKFGREIESRAAIEAEIARLMSVGKFGSESPISNVLLAIQGGPGTVKTIYESLTNKTPVVVVDGSGKACNAVAFAYKLPKPGERLDGTPYTEEKLKDLIMEEFAVNQSHHIFKLVFEYSLKCVREHRDYIHVYEASYSGAGSDVSLDYAILNAVLDPQQDQQKWGNWRAKKVAEGVEEVTARLRQRDLARALKLEMALMWNRIGVVQKEVSEYCVLPSLAKLSQTLTYVVLPKGAKTYRSTTNADVTLKEKDKVVVQQIRDQRWLVTVTSKDGSKEHVWMLGGHLKQSGSSFADTVTLAHMQMLEYLLLNEKLEFVKLFLQGMREYDIHAFLAVKRKELWAQAASFVPKKDSETSSSATGTGPAAGADSEDTIQYLKRSSLVRKRNSIKMLTDLKEGRISHPSQMMEKSNSSKKSLKASSHTSNTLALPRHGAKTHIERPASGLSHSEQLDEEAQNLLMQVKAFDDSDIHLPPYVNDQFFRAVGDAQLKCWLSKKKKQIQLGFTISSSHRDLVAKLENERHPTLRMLSEREKLIRYDWTIWFLKFILNRGYMITACSSSQLSHGPEKLARIDSALNLVESLAETLHHRWLQKKVEDHWKYGPRFVNENGKQESPYLLLFSELPPASKQHNIMYARALLTTVLEKGLWIWRPDNLELLYFRSIEIVGAQSHLERRLPKGQFWRAEVHSALADVIGGDYVRDFSTYNALDPWYHLMVWAILTFRFELATFFWEQKKDDSLINALMAALICTKMAEKDKALTPEQKTEYLEYAESHKTNALEVLEECISRDSTQTRRLLKAQYPQAGWMTMWGAAYLLKDRKITSRPLFIEVVGDEWLGNLLRPANFAKVCTGILLPVPYVIMYTEAQPTTLRGKILEALTLRMDDTELRRVAAPTIIFTGKDRPLLLTSATFGATITYTTDGTDPRIEGLTYVEGYGSSTEEEKVTSIKLNESRIYIIKAYASKHGLDDSAVTEKLIDMGQIDKVEADVPSFVFGPKPSISAWGSAGALGTAMYRIRSFYDAPYATFFTFMLTSLAYTLLYSYVAIVTTTSISELSAFDDEEKIITVVVYAWTFTLMVDELRQAISSGFTEWWYGQGGAWNKVDVLVYAIVTISALLRLSENSDFLRASRFLFALGALVVWLRLSRMYALSQSLGPKLVMIFTMMGDVFVFLALLIIVLIGYGVAMHSILMPYRTFDVSSPMTILVKPMFNAIGDTFIEEIRVQTHCLGDDFTLCDDYGPYLVLALLVGYLIISNILLVNLLIAMMAETYSRLESQSIDIWSLQNIDLLEEFRELLPLPPPLNLLYNIYDLLRYIIGYIIGRKAFHGAKVGPSKKGRVEICHVDSEQQLTAANRAFLRKSTEIRTMKVVLADKSKIMQTAIEELIKRRMKHVDDKLEGLNYLMVNLSNDFKDLKQEQAQDDVKRGDRRRAIKSTDS